MPAAALEVLFWTAVVAAVASGIVAVWSWRDVRKRERPNEGDR